MNPIYQESNRTLSNRGICFFLMIFALIEALMVVIYLHPEYNPGKPPMTVEMLVALLILFVFLFILMLILKVRVTVYGDKIRIKTVGTKVITKDRIESAELCEMKAVRRFGGYGIRWRPGKTGYTSDYLHCGVIVRTTDGHETYIMSAEPQKLLDAILDKN